jgi:quercetin dioxygenase-like cupin family protein
MEILRLDARLADPITEFGSRGATASRVAEGAGEARVAVVHLEPGGEIGPHEAGFGQLFYAARGSGWAAGADGARLPLAEGEAALIRRGEVHSKGSDTGMTAVVVQVRDLATAGTPRS